SLAGYVTSTVGPPQSLGTGYAVLSCSGRVAVNTLYRYSNPDGSARSMATVFSQGPFQNASFAVYQDVPTIHLGIAIANNNSAPVTLTVNANVNGSIVGKQLTIAAQSSMSQFLEQMIPSTANTGSLVLPVVYIQAPSILQDVYATGLLYDGDAFSTIPLTIYQ